MSRAIFLPKWTELLIVLYNTPADHRYCERLHRRIGISIKHLRSLIADLEDMGIISRQTRGKIKYVTLTETGERLAELFLQVYPELRR